MTSTDDLEQLEIGKQQIKGQACEDAEAKAAAKVKADTAADKPPEADDIKEEDWVELRDVLLGWQTFGLFSIFMTHPLDSRKDYFIKMLPLLLLVAQLLIPSFLFASAYAKYEKGLCPGTGPTEINRRRKGAPF